MTERLRTVKLVIGTRGSNLALTQTKLVIQHLARHHDQLDAEVKVIKTTGDVFREASLKKISGKGVFVKEIEDALLDGEIDLAVHSMKDMPTEQPAGLVIAASPDRADPRDALVSRDDLSLDELPEGARIGTGSFRRGAQLLNYRPDLEIADIRGNVDTRLQKLNEGQYDAVVLAAAGLERLGHEDRATQYLDPEVMLPAVGQGILALEARHQDADPQTHAILAPIGDDATWIAAQAERAFLRRLGGGCKVPMGAYARIGKGQLRIDGLVATPHGRRVVRASLSDDIGGPDDPRVEGLAIELAEALLESGAGEILSEALTAVEG